MMSSSNSKAAVTAEQMRASEMQEGQNHSLDEAGDADANLDPGKQ